MWCTYLTYFIHNSSVRDSTAVFLPAPRPCLRCGACTCWALQRTQRAKGMKQLQITRNFCSPRIIHSVCLLLWVSPIMFLREKQVFISHHCAGSQGVLPQTASATPHPAHLTSGDMRTSVRGKPWQASSRGPPLLDCSKFSETLGQLYRLQN